MYLTKELKMRKLTQNITFYQRRQQFRRIIWNDQLAVATKMKVFDAQYKVCAQGAYAEGHMKTDIQKTPFWS